MSCYHPIDGHLCQGRGGRFRASSNSPLNCCSGRSIKVPCNDCVGCHLQYSRDWAIRNMHEASLYSSSCYVTLTFSPKFLPDDNGLHYSIFQSFMKSFRERFTGCDLVSHPYFGQIDKRWNKPYPEFYKPLRFYMCGEYGEKRGRPHFHALFFNFDFPDKKYWYTSRDGFKVYRSAELEKLWPYGHSEIGSVTFQSAAYVARYIMKKAKGRDKEYDYVDPETGCFRNPEFTKMSLKPGIGEGWLRKYYSDVYPHDFIVHNGARLRPPRYYDKKYFDLTKKIREVVWKDDRLVPAFLVPDAPAFQVERIWSSVEFDEVKEARVDRALLNLDDNTPSRLKVKEALALDRVSRLRRSLS